MAQKCPQITGAVRNKSAKQALFNQNDTLSTGAFTLEWSSEVNSANLGEKVGSYQTGVVFSASRNNSIYTNENLVRPFSTSTRLLIRY